MNIRKATSQYEQWLTAYTPLIAADLADKHRQMALGAFPFLRATFYRWAQTWPERCPALASAPLVLSVGDLHVENFGTWRDAEGRLIWGVNDFDEACYLPYANDLVRLATSAQLAIEANHLCVECVHACEAILDGYREGLAAGGRPFVLAEEHAWLRDVAHTSLSDPVTYWNKMDSLPEAKAVPESARVAVEHVLPPGARLCGKAPRCGSGQSGPPALCGNHALGRWQYCQGSESPRAFRLHMGRTGRRRGRDILPGDHGPRGALSGPVRAIAGALDRAPPGA